MAINVRWSIIILSQLLLVKGVDGFAQMAFKDSLVTESRISAYSIDQQGNIFLGFDNGTITKYNTELDSLLSYNPTRVGKFSLIEAWHGFQVFAFNNKFQDFILLDRFLSRESRYALGETGMYYVDLSTLSGEQNLWLIEENGLRLMKYDFKAREIILDISLNNWLDNQEHAFTFMREYQNLLFLIDKNSGIYVFDNLANIIRKIYVVNVDYVSLSGETLYYLTDEAIISMNLYSNVQSEIKIDQRDYKGLLVFKNFGYLVSDQRVEMIEIPEN